MRGLCVGSVWALAWALGWALAWALAQALCGFWGGSGAGSGAVLGALCLGPFWAEIQAESTDRPAGWFFGLRAHFSSRTGPRGTFSGPEAGLPRRPGNWRWGLRFRGTQGGFSGVSRPADFRRRACRAASSVRPRRLLPGSRLWLDVRVPQRAVIGRVIHWSGLSCWGVVRYYGPV